MDTFKVSLADIYKTVPWRGPPWVDKSTLGQRAHLQPVRFPKLNTFSLHFLLLVLLSTYPYPYSLGVHSIPSISPTFRQVQSGVGALSLCLSALLPSHFLPISSHTHLNGVVHFLHCLRSPAHLIASL